MRRWGFAGLLLLCLLVAVSCRREPVARLAVSARQIELAHGTVVPFELRWEMTGELPQGTVPITFVHLLDAEGNIIRTFDHELPRWQPGRLLRDPVPLYHSTIGPAIPAGEYRLTAGLYDGGKNRFDLGVDGEELKRKEYVIARVTVPPVDAAAPVFTFSPEWLATEPGSDRQAVARRTLVGDGSLEASGLPAPTRLWLLLSLPKVEPPLRLMLEPQARQPGVRVTADCGVGFSADVSGEGLHELIVPVRAAAPCRVAFDTNYAVVDTSTGKRTSFVLHQLAWEARAQAPSSGPAAATGG